MSALVAITMGSKSDWTYLEDTFKTLNQLEIPAEPLIISAHRTPDRLYQFARDADKNGYRIIIAGAGGAAHLPGMLASLTTLPVIGVPIPSTHLNGIDSLLSICQMPAGIPVATMSIGRSGAINAALNAASILALQDSTIKQRLIEFKNSQTNAIPLSPIDVE